MPYKITSVKGGFKVSKQDGSLIKGRRYTSNKPMTKENAIKQIRAMHLKEKKGKKN
tara:strand:+ start:334 stop:501 length:168 start_codon:yes stop_codon:yes gene_type:complete